MASALSKCMRFSNPPLNESIPDVKLGISRDGTAAGLAGFEEFDRFMRANDLMYLYLTREASQCGLDENTKLKLLLVCMSKRALFNQDKVLDAAKKGYTL